MINSISSTKIFSVLFFSFFVLNLKAQTTGSMFMMQDNFRTQMINPALNRSDKTIVFAIPGLSGITFGNSGNFKFSDVIRRQANDQLVVDVEHFYNLGIAKTRLTSWSVLPYFYFSSPTKKGRLSVYFKEQVSTSLKFSTKAINFFSEGNQSKEFKSYNTNAIYANGIDYRELGVGYLTNHSDELTIGFRGKLLFGAAFADIRDWNYGIETDENGEEVELISNGKGRLAVPFGLFDAEGKVRNVEFDEGLKGYLKNYHNPGLAIDLGFNLLINEKAQLSAAVSDLGAIWFQHNAYVFNEESSYSFTGFDLSNSLDNNNSEDYIDSYDLVFNTKDSIRGVFKPAPDTATFVKVLSPKTVIHYLYETSERHSLGITNQTVFLHKNILNKLTFSAKHKFGSLSIFENINLHNVNGVTLGGGLQWDASFFQLFFATDNVLAFYHPANQKSFTASFGLSFLLRKREDRKRDKKGKYDPWRPFFEKKKG